MTRVAIAFPAVSWPAPAGVVTRLLGLLALRRSRRSLRQLDTRGLRDVGLSREEALLESRRPFWDAPDHWLR